MMRQTMTLVMPAAEDIRRLPGEVADELCVLGMISHYVQICDYMIVTRQGIRAGSNLKE
jgi:hypothetical protein